MKNKKIKNILVILTVFSTSFAFAMTSDSGNEQEEIDGTEWEVVECLTLDEKDHVKECLVVNIGGPAINFSKTLKVVQPKKEVEIDPSDYFAGWEILKLDGNGHVLARQPYRP
jgi:hypothetical protein